MGAGEEDKRTVLGAKSPSFLYVLSRAKIQPDQPALLQARCRGQSPCRNQAGTGWGRMEKAARDGTRTQAGAAGSHQALCSERKPRHHKTSQHLILLCPARCPQIQSLLCSLPPITNMDLLLFFWKEEPTPVGLFYTPADGDTLLVTVITNNISSAPDLPVWLPSGWEVPGQAAAGLGTGTAGGAQLIAIPQGSLLALGLFCAHLTEHQLLFLLPGRPAREPHACPGSWVAVLPTEPSWLF